MQGEERRDRGFRAHEAEQRRAWLALSHRQRLEWLEGAKRFATRALAAARNRAQDPGSPRRS